MHRRQLLQLGLGSLLISACGRGARSAPRDALLPTPQVDDGDPSPAMDPGLRSQHVPCLATADNIEGPFYKVGAPRRATLVGARDPGERLQLRGSVQSMSCAPIAGAVLDFWHADHRGAYDNDGFGLRGRLVTDVRGDWQLETIVPGRYLNGRRYRPAHIHVKVRAPGRPELTTQLYFEGDPYLRGDPWVVGSLVMSHERRGQHRQATFDFVV